MFETDMLEAESGLKEVINLFDECDGLNIKHKCKVAGNKFVNTVIINGQAKCYGNLAEYKNETEEKRLKIRYAKLSLYKAISGVTGKSMPWGALTGIRPTKLAYTQLEETGEFKDFFVDTMKVSEEKTKLVADILETQTGVYDKDSKDTELFVSIPFCPTRCEYCSFISVEVGKIKDILPEYIDALIKELDAAKPYIKNLKSVYIGGGTPVSIGNDNLERVLKAVRSVIGNEKVEYTVEAGRPDAITEENLDLLKRYGVTRICVNPQTFNDKTLEIIGRKHTAKEVIDKYELAKGKFDINMDLIAGLTGESFADFKYSLDKAIELSPEDITVHTLALKAGSKLKEKTERLDSGDIGEMVDYAHKTLKEKGYKPYYLYRQKYMKGNLENTGYCKDGKACVYNIAVMEETSNNVAVGANAITKRVFKDENRIERYANPKDTATYIAKIDKIIEDKAKLFE